MEEEPVFGSISAHREHIEEKKRAQEEFERALAEKKNSGRKAAYAAGLRRPIAKPSELRERKVQEEFASRIAARPKPDSLRPRKKVPRKTAANIAALGVPIGNFSDLKKRYEAKKKSEQKTLIEQALAKQEKKNSLRSIKTVTAKKPVRKVTLPKTINLEILKSPKSMATKLPASALKGILPARLVKNKKVSDPLESWTFKKSLSTGSRLYYGIFTPKKGVQVSAAGRELLKGKSIPSYYKRVPLAFLKEKGVKDLPEKKTSKGTTRTPLNSRTVSKRVNFTGRVHAYFKRDGITVTPAAVKQIEGILSRTDKRFLIGLKRAAKLTGVTEINRRHVSAYHEAHWKYYIAAAGLSKGRKALTLVPTGKKEVEL